MQYTFVSEYHMMVEWTDARLSVKISKYAIKKYFVFRHSNLGLKEVFSAFLCSFGVIILILLNKGEWKQKLCCLNCYVSKELTFLLGASTTTKNVWTFNPFLSFSVLFKLYVLIEYFTYLYGTRFGT